MPKGRDCNTCSTPTASGGTMTTSPNPQASRGGNDGNSGEVTYWEQVQQSQSDKK